MHPDATAGSRALSLAGMPGVEGAGRPLPRLESFQRVQELLLRHGGAEVLAPEGHPDRPSEHTRAVALSTRIDRLALVALRIEHRARRFGVVGPGPPIEVVGAHRDPDVVDHADLPVDIDGAAVLVLDVIEGHPRPTRLAHHRHRIELADPVQRTGDEAVSVRILGNDNDHSEVR